MLIKNQMMMMMMTKICAQVLSNHFRALSLSRNSVRRLTRGVQCDHNGLTVPYNLNSNKQAKTILLSTLSVRSFIA